MCYQFEYSSEIRGYHMYKDILYPSLEIHSRTGQWLLWWFYCGYHWKWYCCYIRILAVIIPPEDVALDKQSVDNGKEVLTSRLKYLHIAISLPGVHWKYLQQLHGILRGYLSLLFNKYPQILKFLTLKLISPMVNNSTIQMVMII